jgi:DNA-binding NarL/FixJ family response regulator
MTRLTQRELEVLEQISLGKVHKEIADSLSITAATLKSHIASIYNKLDVHNHVQALRAVGFQMNEEVDEEEEDT